jgi:16S rRNA (guanine527-N7)-methyltransferase
LTEEEARAWLHAKLDVPRETLATLECYVDALRSEAAQQNLVAASTLDHLWARHIVDSAQLIPISRETPGPWLDLGSGAGLPGLIIAILTDRPVTLVEPRRKRADFLTDTAARHGLEQRVTVVQKKVEQLEDGRFAVISARAFAPLDRLLPLAARFAGPETLWLLPKGRSARAELDAARGSWQGVFSLAPSLTDPESAIIVARNVRPRGRGSR